MALPPYVARLLAQQSVCARLIVERKPTTTDGFQRETETYIRYTDPASYNERIETGHSVTNLNPTIERLPDLSIFSFISFRWADDPNPRNVPVENYNDMLTRSQTSYEELGAQSFMPVRRENAFHPVDPMPPKPMYSTTLPSSFFERDANTAARSDSSSRLNSITDQDPAFQDIANGPMNINPATMRKIMGTRFSNIITQLGQQTRVIEGNTRTSVAENIWRYFNIDPNAARLVVSGANKNMNAITVKVGLTDVVIRNLDNSEIPLLDDQLMGQIAQNINAAVQEISRGTNAISPPKASTSASAAASANADISGL